MLATNANMLRPKEPVKLHVAAPQHDCEPIVFRVDETGWLVAQDPTMKTKLDKLRQSYPNIDFDTLQNVLAAHEGCIHQTKQVGAHLGQLNFALVVQGQQQPQNSSSACIALTSLDAVPWRERAIKLYGSHVSSLNCIINRVIDCIINCMARP